MIIYRWWGVVCDGVCLFSGLWKCLFKEFHKKGWLTDFGFDLKLEVTLRVNLNLDLGFLGSVHANLRLDSWNLPRFAHTTVPLLWNQSFKTTTSDYYCYLSRPHFSMETVRDSRWWLNIRGGTKFNTEKLLPTWLNEPSSNKHYKDKEHDK